ncbi:MAG: hypothetical protein JXA03_10040 [Bacteroidales bacterium]|nr:hypothetical protein [Bacteroidales bacterium]
MNKLFRTIRKLMLLTTASLAAIMLLLDKANGQTFTQRQIVLNEITKRPNDLWPRGDGHALIGEPGGPVSQKGYHEPGGSFSPSPGSFGMAIWVYDSSDKFVATSDNIPMEKIKQEFIWLEGRNIPSIHTTTPYYSCTWTYSDLGYWQFDLEKPSGSYNKIMLVFRSTGPAGGPLYSSVWDKTRLLLGHRWIVVPSPYPVEILTGDEEKGELFTTGSNAPVESANGWAFAKLRFDNAKIVLKINDTKPVFESHLSYGKTTCQFKIEVPDTQFTACLDAQVANLMMGYTGRQTGPGEPVNYPLAWERDGAYSLIAMARSGNLQTARELSAYFAENDFFGGFGAEGDAPGSAISALAEVAFLIDEPEYYQWVWPHIARKLEYIEEMMNATGNVYKNYIGPVAPHLQDDLNRRRLICLKAEDGLITGAMDLHFPVLYINAVSYRGLMQASKLAKIVYKPDVAAHCIDLAGKIKSAWVEGFGQEKYNNERNFMISIWPSWIIDKSFRPYQKGITSFRASLWKDGEPIERPLWTYFFVAEAHQWLFLDKPEQVWETLNYFWRNQCSSGLYTFWEGNGEENSFHGWDNYRGWLMPKYVTPHYWTASEMLLLQLDMLACFDESGAEPELVVGGGVPAEWLSEKMGLEKYKTRNGTISWHYAQNQLKVEISGARSEYKVRAGTAFGNNVRLSVEFK